MAPVTPLSLFEAMCAFGDPDRVSEMICLDHQGYSGPKIFFMGPITGDELPVWRYRELRQQLEEDLVAKLRAGTLVAIGYDSRAPISAPAVTIPADRWHVLVPNFDASTATDAGIDVTGILVQRVSSIEAPSQPTAAMAEDGLGQVRVGSAAIPGLQIVKAARHASWNGLDLKFSPMSFALLLLLAEKARTGAAPVALRELEDKLFAANFDSKALARAVGRLKTEMIRSGLNPTDAQALIENVRTVGYRLRVPASEIAIED